MESSFLHLYRERIAFVAGRRRGQAGRQHIMLSSISCRSLPPSRLQHKQATKFALECWKVHFQFSWTLLRQFFFSFSKFREFWILFYFFIWLNRSFTFLTLSCFAQFLLLKLWNSSYQAIQFSFVIRRRYVTILTLKSLKRRLIHSWSWLIGHFKWQKSSDCV